MPEIIYLEPGESCPAAQTGDILMIKGTSWISRLILLVEPYSHVVPFVDAEHGADAQSRGVVERAVSVYENTERVFVRLDAHRLDRAQMSEFLTSVLKARWRYSYLGFAISALMIFTGGKLSVRRYNTSYCSGLVAECVVRCGAVFPKPPSSMTPGDLAKYFGVI